MYAGKLRTRVGVAVGAATVMLGMLAGCSFQAEKATAQRIIRSADAAARMGTAEGTFEQVITLVPPRRGQRQAGVGLQGVTFPRMSGTLAVDFNAFRASMTPTQAVPGQLGPGGAQLAGGIQLGGAGQGSPAAAGAAEAPGEAAASNQAAAAAAAAAAAGPKPPNLIFDRWRMYAQARNQPGGQAAGGEAEDAEEVEDTEQIVRDWFFMDFAEMSNKDRSQITQGTSVNAVNPVLLFRMLAGTLSGSVKRVGTAEVGGVQTTHYRMNVDREKAVQKLSDKDKRAIEKLFRTDNLTGVVYKNAEVWLDAEGRPRRFTVQLPQTIDTFNKVRWRYTFEVTKYGGPIAIELPSPDRTSEVGTLQQLIAAVAPRS